LQRLLVKAEQQEAWAERQVEAEPEQLAVKLVEPGQNLPLS
jgi:hypothetical protein